MRPFRRLFSSFSSTAPESPPAPQRHLVNAFILSAFLLWVYLLSFEGRFSSIDELNLYSMAESVVQTGTFDVPQVKFAAYHNPVGRHEVGFPLAAAPLYAFAGWTSSLNNIYMVMLLNPLLVAASGGLIYLSAVKLGGSLRAAAFAGLGYGLASLAWPYAQLFLREPLVGFLLIFAFTAFVHGRDERHRRWWLIGAAALMLVPLVKINVIFSAAFLPLAAFRRPLRITWRSVGLGTLLLSLAFAGFQLLAFLRLNTFINPLNYLTLDAFQLVLIRSYGQLASPIKGLIFYMPLAIWAIPGLISMFTDPKRRTAAWSIVLCFGSLLLLIGLYSAWDGGQAWGPRLLVPVLPLLALSWAAAWDRLEHLAWRIGIGVTFGLSTVVQVLVITNDWWNGYAPIFALSPDPENNIGLSYRYLIYSPPIQLLLNWRPEDFDLIWLHHDWENGWTFNLWVVAVLMIGSLLFGFLWRSGRLIQYPIRLGSLFLVAVIGLYQLCASPIVISYPGLSSENSHAISDWVNGEGSATTPYTMVTMSNEFHTFFMNGLMSGNYVHHWVSPAEIDRFETLIDETKGDQLYFVADRVHIDPTYSGKELEWWLNETYYRYDSAWHGEYETVRYGIVPDDAFEWQTVDADFGPLQVSQIGTSAASAEAGTIVGVQLEICRTDTPPAVHQLFVHLMGPNGMIHGLDGPIGYGSVELSGLTDGDCLIEKRGIRIPDEAVPGDYEVVFGFTTLDGPLTLTHDPASTYAVASAVDVQDSRLALAWPPASILTGNMAFWR